MFLIVYDLWLEVNGICGMVCDVLVESIDMVLIFVEVVGGEVVDYIFEGCLLMFWIEG